MLNLYKNSIQTVLNVSFAGQESLEGAVFAYGLQRCVLGSLNPDGSCVNTTARASSLLPDFGLLRPQMRLQWILEHFHFRTC